MENYKFFQNCKCEYFPCHEGVSKENFSCLFCYCPLYNQAKCPGTYTYIELNGKKIKECTNCTFPHQIEHYDCIVKILSEP